MRRDTQRAMAGFGGFALLAAAITTVSLVVGDAEPAGAATLTRFESCDAMRTWVEAVQVEEQERFEEDFSSEAAMESGAGSETSAVASAPTSDAGRATAGRAAPQADSATPSPAGTGGTNTVVEGVDEIDIVEQLPGGRALVARNGTLSLVDLEDLEVRGSQRGLPPDARISVGGDVVWVAGSEGDGTGVVVRRFRLEDSSLVEDGRWTTPGQLLDARRTGDRLHVLAVDHPYEPGAIPFEDGPVPCDEVWRPGNGADTPAATLLATLPATGDLTPTATAEVVGSGHGFLVTDTSAFVTTQRYGETLETGVHRFELATLTPTGSGTVPGMVPGPFGLSEHGGHLRVATNAQASFAIAGGPAMDVAIDAPAPRPRGGDDEPLAEVFVLDLDGALDVVGRTGRFGHAGESIHGVRFVGDIAYVVTFLQTDPFWILDLSDPAAPETVGELEIPGFSGYLHPVSDERVVGFGPDGEGGVAARLFDVSDRTAPSLLDQIALGQESPVVHDHHAYVAADGGRFAVPVNDMPTYVGETCEPGPVPRPEPLPRPAPLPGPMPVEPDGGDGSGGTPPPGIVQPDGGGICTPILEGGSSGVAVLAVEAGRLVLADEQSVASDGNFMAERVLPTPSGGWVLVGYDRLVDPAGGQLVLPS